LTVPPAQWRQGRKNIGAAERTAAADGAAEGGGTGGTIKRTRTGAHRRSETNQDGGTAGAMRLTRMEIASVPRGRQGREQAAETRSVILSVR